MTFSVESVDWRKAKKQLITLREKVYVYEWRIPRDQEFDQLDNDAHHVLLKDDGGNNIATGRITAKGELGRIAVIPSYRTSEVYQALFTALLEVAKQHEIQNISVQCELQGVNNYQQQGFRPVGSVYMDAGIPRQRMCCSVSNFSLPKVEWIH